VKRAAAAAAALCSGKLLALSNDLVAIVVHALGTDTMGQTSGTTLGAGVDAGILQLPHGATALVTTLLGNFTLRDGHF
jgi:hypothetical protein